MPSDTDRTATVYLVLERTSQRRWTPEPTAIVVGKSARPPTLKRGQCAVKVKLKIADAAFEPRFATGELAFAVEDTLQATTTKERP